MAQAFPEVDPNTGRVINPEKWSPDEVRRAQQLAGNQVGVAIMTDEMMHQAAKYEAEHQNFLATKMDSTNPKVQAMADMTPEVMYQRLRKQKKKGGY